MIRSRLSATVFVATAVVIAALFAAAARADIIAAVGVSGPGDDGLDIALIDTATGTHLGLPAGINTTAQELDPSITPDGKRLAFERFDSVTHAVRIIVADLATGQQADLFNAFEAGQYMPVNPTITPDGTTVITGAASQPSGNLFVPTWIETDISGFPTGPFPHTVRQQPNLGVSEPGSTSDPSFDPSAGVHGITALTWHRTHSPPVADAIIVSDSGKDTPVFDNGRSIESPAYSSAAGVLLFVRPGTVLGEFDLAYRTLSTFGAPEGTTFLVPGVNSSTSSNFSPTFTANGRYIVYGHRPSGGRSHLLVYDTATQTLLDPSGIDPGGDVLGRISVFEKFILKSTVFVTGVNPSLLFTLSGSSSVGILVQRIVGHHKLFGRRVPVLRKVGRVPFGAFRRGKHRVRWDLRVNGHKLRRGRYLITPRALTKKGVVRELGKPHVLRVR
jgi:WD40-like Beta Propeller Repeat